MGRKGKASTDTRTQRIVAWLWLLGVVGVVAGIFAASMLVEEAALARYTALFGGIGFLVLFGFSLRAAIRDWADAESFARLVLVLPCIVLLALAVAQLVRFRLLHDYEFATRPQRAPVAQEPLGWLATLAGHCWHESSFGSDSCFWRSDAHSLALLSRNHGKLLACARLVVGTDGRSVTQYGWDEERAEPPMAMRLEAGALWSYEDLPASSDGARQSTTMRLQDSTSFTMTREQRDAAGAARATGATGAALRFERRGKFAATDPLALRCAALEHLR